MKTLADLQAVYRLPLPELMFRAAQVHRKNHEPADIQRCALLSVKTGGCSEDCGYCAQSAHFKTDVSATPLLELEEVREKATRAKELGLVDEVGTLEDAIAAAKTAAGVGEKDNVDLLMLPKPVSPFEQLLGPLDPETRAESRLSQLIWKDLARLLPAELLAPLREISVMELLAKEKALSVLPYRVDVK